MRVTRGGGTLDEDEHGLADSLAGLSGLVNSDRGLEDTLVRVAGFAVAAIPEAEGAGLTLLEAGRHQTVVSTTDFVNAVDDIQYGLGEGPCVSAVAEARTVTSGNLGGEPQWPRFGPRVGRLGVHSALSVPLIVDGTVIGAMNIYAHGKHAFNLQSIRLGEAFAGPAAVSVANARLLAQAQRVAAQLQTALSTRAEIDRAIGILMSRTGVSPEQAFDRLRKMSNEENQKLAEVARVLVADATARARARHTSDGA